MDVAFSEVEAMSAQLEHDLDRLYAGLCASVVLFGSYARGNQTTGSDVDVLLVVADTTAKSAVEGEVDAGALAFMNRWGAPLSAIVYTMAEAAALRREDEGGLYTDLDRDGVVISGVPPREWGTHEGSGERSDGAAV